MRIIIFEDMKRAKRTNFYILINLKQEIMIKSESIIFSSKEAVPLFIANSS